MGYFSRGASTIGDRVKRFLSVLALAASLAPAHAQTTGAGGQAGPPSAWGNFDWSQITAPPAAAPRRLAPPSAPLDAGAPVSGTFRQPRTTAAPQAAARKPATPATPGTAAVPPSAGAPSSYLAARQVPLPPRRSVAPAGPAISSDRPDPPPDRTDRSPPLAILLDGLGIYVQQDYVGVSALARPLQQQGYRTLADTHFMRKVSINRPDQVPAVIIGHSMGGQSALKLARQIVQAGLPEPLVLTVDAAPLPSACPVRTCINIFSPGFPRVTGAQNIDAWENGANLTNHAMLASHPSIQRMLLQYTAALIAQRQSVAQRSAGN